MHDEGSVLERKIRYYRKCYYNGKPEISDAEFDKLEKRLRKIKPDSRTLKEVGATIPQKKVKIKLPFILGSLDKVGTDDVLKWIKATNDDIVVTHKLDGCSVYAQWEYGKLTMLATRGDSEIGEDIYFKANKIKDIPLNINYLGKIAARGEIVCNEIPKGYKTKRNAATGIINRDDTKGCEHLEVFFYELITHENLPKTEEKRLKLLSSFLRTVAFTVIEKKNIDNATSRLLSILDSSKKFNIDVDGLVLTPNKAQRENVKYPKNKVAFKVNDESIETKVESIEFNTSRTGRVVPVVHISTVEVNGVGIQHPTGHNYKWIKERGIDKGAIIKVVRSGDVIPYITDVVKPVKVKTSIPTKCPSCGTALQESGVDLICVGSKCPAKDIGQIEYFIRALGAENVAYATLQKLYEAKLVKSVFDLFELKKEKLVKIDGLGDISADNLLAEISKVLTTKEENLITAFGMDKIGIKNAIKIVDALGLRKNFEKVFSTPVDLLKKTLMQVPGFGPAVTQSFCDIYGYKDIYDYLIKRGLKFVKEKRTNKLGGKRFMFTGAMSRPREELEKMVMTNGGYINPVSRNLDYLVCVDLLSQSSKAKKARELGINMITEEQFMKMLGV